MSTRQIGGMRFAPGQTLNDRYEILQTLGQGGMGEAYKARDRQTGQIVVVKIPYASMIGDPSTYSRYQRELDIGKRLDHPGIQRFLADGRLDDSVAPYLVFEFIDGQNFREFLANRAPLDVDLVVDLAALTRVESPLRDAAFTHFYERFRNDPLVLDKWMGLQATSPLPETATTATAKFLPTAIAAS